MSASLLPPSASTLERALEETLGCRIDDIPVNLQSLWNPNTCPLAFLPFLAWTYSVDVWNENWPEHIKRSQIKSAAALHRIKGTRRAVEDAIGSFGVSILLEEWFEQTPPGVPGTFAITINYGGTSVAAELVDDLFKTVDQVKRESAHYTVQTGIGLERSMNVGASVRVMQFVRLALTDTGV